MATQTTQKQATSPDGTAKAQPAVTRRQFAQLLNEDLAREYQAIIGYVVYSQAIKGAAYMQIAETLELHAKEELQHALTIARLVDYLGEMPTNEMKPVRLSEDTEQMLRFDLENEAETIRNYRERVRQSEALGEYAITEQLRGILVQEQDHLIELATALGMDASEAV